MNAHRYCCRTILLIVFFLASLITLLSCSKKEEAAAPVASRFRSDNSAAPVAEPAAPSLSETAGDAEAERPGNKSARRKVIMSHSLDLEVRSLSDAMESLGRLAESNGGYVYESTRSRYDRNAYSGTIGIRVPTGRTGSILAAIRGMGRVEGERSNAEDITDDYVDMEARLKNAQATEDRLKEMYRRAATVKDVLAVEKELTRVRGDIEAYMAKKRNWDLLVEMATIEVNLREPSAVMPGARNFWEPIRSAFGRSLEAFAESVRALIIFIGAIAPWLVIVVPAVYLFFRFIKKRRNRTRKGPVPAKED